MKVLFFMSHPGAARNFESTIRGLATEGHQVHMAFSRTEKKNLPGLSDLANTLVAEYPGITSGEHPEPPKTDWALVSRRLRLSLDYMRFLGPEYRDAPKLKQRAESWVPPRVERIIARTPGPGKAMLRSAFRSAQRSIPVDEALQDYLREQNADVVLVTPLLEPGSPQTEFLRAANSIGLPTCLCVHSWDNLTNKGLIHEQPDAVTVWNEPQRDEAAELHRVPPDRVVVTGASSYDHWFDWRASRGRREFAEAVGLNPERPFVLYLGSSGFIAPDEAAFVVEWIEGLRKQGLEGVQVLVRPHPVNPMIGKEPSHAALAELDEVVLYPRAGANPTDEESRSDYFDSLHHSSAVTGVNTSGFLEAAILGRPVVVLRSDRYRETQDGMLHFHHLLTAGGGLLHTADTYEEHADQLRTALSVPDPENTADEQSLSFTTAFIRPYGLDEPSTPRMVATVEELAERSNGGRSRTTLTGSALARMARAPVSRARRKAHRAKRARDAERVRSGKPKKKREAKPPKAKKPPKEKKPKEKGKPKEKVKKPKASESATPPAADPVGRQ